MSQHSPSSPNTGNEAHIQLQLSLDDFGSEDGSKDAHGSADVDYETSFAAIMGSSPRAPRSNGNGNSAVNGDYHGQGREDGDEEEEEEGFFYSGVDRQAGILDDENEDADVDADVDADADAQSEAYSAQMRSILGSDAASEENVGQDEEEDADESFTYPAPPSHSVGDASFATDSALPDISFDGPEYQAALSPSATGSLGALSPATARGSVGARPDYFSPSPSPSLALSRSSSMFGAPDSRPRRPATYPSINRLRSSFARQPSFGTERSLSSAGIGGGFFPFATPKAGATATPSLRSRASSASGSALPPRMFPYSTSSQGNGPTRTVEGTVLAPSPAVASETGAAASPIPAGGSASSSSGPAQQDFLRWSSLRKIANNMYPPPGRTPLGRAAGLGEPTVLAVAGGLIAVGTTRGRTMVFEYSQELKCVCGTDIIAQEGGMVTALAISSDHTFVGVGHATGHIALYDLSKPAAPARHVPPVTLGAVASGRKEGHLAGSKILHVGFIGARHTAIVTADESGLAFYHALGKILGVSSNDTLRILGRYPDRGPKGLPLPPGSRKKTSTIFAMSPLPLGPAPHIADQHQFTALLTPSKLVLVGLKPSARTWYRYLAPKRAAPASKSASKENGESIPLPQSVASADESNTQTQDKSEAVIGALAWYPATTLEEDQKENGGFARVHPVLAFSFGKELRFLRVGTTKLQSRTSDTRQTTPTSVHEQLELREEPGWRSDEVILGIQWLNHQLLVLLTPSALSLFDLRVQKATQRQPLDPHVHNLVSHEWYAEALGQLGEKVEGEDAVPPARSAAQASSHSMRVYKGKAFLLTRTELVVGTLLSWADRILTYVSTGDFLLAIQLATAYYKGEAQGSTIGLPEERGAQQCVVGHKLRELMAASMLYTFSEDRMTDATHVTPDGRGVDRTPVFEGLARTCAEACLALEDLSFLFDDLYDNYQENGIEGIFVAQMEDFIISGRIRTLPTTVVQRLVAYRQNRGEYEYAERVIWHVDPLCLDLDQALSLCQQHRLYDALIYVYNKALHDYVSPVVELLEVLKQVLHHRQERPSRVGEDPEDADASAEEYDESSVSNVYKMFSYLSVVLPGLAYPSQEPLPDTEAVEAKTAVYSFLFSGRCIVWPPGAGGKLVLSVDEDKVEPTYPYLRLLLRFDAEAFLDALDVAFEDSYLDDEIAGKRVNRQLVINILLELADADEQLLPSDATFVHIFVARNAPKYPQFILLPPSALHRLLVALAESPDQSTREDRQLAAECLLSSYTPHHDDELLSVFERARFFRILRSAYRAERKWPELIATFLRDPEAATDVFAQLADVLGRAAKERKGAPGTAGTAGLGEVISNMTLDAVPQLVDSDVRETAALVDRFLPNEHSNALERLELSPHRQLAYLRCFLDPQQSQEDEAAGARPLTAAHLDAGARDMYVSLLSKYEPSSLLPNLDAREPDFFDLEHVAEVCESEGAYDAVLWALDRRGRPGAAFDALDRIMAGRAVELCRARARADENGAGGRDGEGALEQVRAVMSMAVRLCTERSRSEHQPPRLDVLDTDEMWFRLLRSLVELVQSAASTAASDAGEEGEKRRSSEGAPMPLLASCRELVQDTLASLVSSTSTESVSFPTLFKRLVEASPSGRARGESPSLSLRFDSSSFAPPAPSTDHLIRGRGQGHYYAEFRAVLDGMLGAYRLRTDLLMIINRLFDRDIFVSFEKLARSQKRGWRPAHGGARCAACAEALIGAGAGAVGSRSRGDGRRFGARAPSLGRGGAGSPGNSAPVTGTAIGDVPVRQDKGKGVARDGVGLGFNDERARGDEDEGGFFDGPRASEPGDYFPLGSAGAGAGEREGEREQEGAEVEEEKKVDRAVIVLRTGVVYHRRCAPAEIVRGLGLERELGRGSVQGTG